MEEKNYTAGELLELIELAEKSSEYWREKSQKTHSECPNCIRNLSLCGLKIGEYYEKAIDVLKNN